MTCIFKENFGCRSGALPANWVIEDNTGILADAIRCGEGCIELLSAGNKFLPIMPDVADFELAMVADVNFEMAGKFGIILSFRYDARLRKGSAFRISASRQSGLLNFEYGNISLNEFAPEKSETMPLDEFDFGNPFELKVSVSGGRAAVTLAGKIVNFEISGEGKGKIALSRKHFFDVLKVLVFEVVTDEEIPCPKERTFTIPMPDECTQEPIFCDVHELDYGEFMDMALSFRGGTAEHEPGEGNYHVMRADIMERPFFNIVSSSKVWSTLLHDGKIVNVVKNLAPDYFYKSLHKKVEWPLQRRIRFIKPAAPVVFALGFDAYCYTPMSNMAQNPCETLFDAAGKVLYSGKSLTSSTKIDFISNEHKQIADRLPKDDPRYEMALTFTRNNHFFLEGEPINFRVRISGRGCAALNGLEIRLEDAYFQVLDSFSCDGIHSRQSYGAFVCDVQEFKLRQLRDLKPGVYHLRVLSTEGAIEDYCAFEVMSNDAGALPPPLLSGLPFLYDSRTETRGLMTDGFDVWYGKSVDKCHYLSCANFLPKAAREFKISPTVHAYGREYFLWLGSRCADKWKMDENKDLIVQADYVSIAHEMAKSSLEWRDSYVGAILQTFIEFAEMLGDPALDVEKLKQRQAENKTADFASIKYVVENYWEEWLDYANKETHKRMVRNIAHLKAINPNAKFSHYGPAPIYAAHLKGPEFIRNLMNDYMTTNEGLGFYQYEDYPDSCGYELDRGVYFLTSCMMSKPDVRFYPEIYTPHGLQGCPDGAVFYAYPPFGFRLPHPNDHLLMKQRVFAYAFATGWFDGNEFRFWDKRGFQACKFNRDWFEALLTAWRIVHEYPAMRPLRSNAFVSSIESCRAQKKAHCDICGDEELIDKDDGAWYFGVRKSATEDVPYAYQCVWKHSECAGFQMMMETLPGLTEKDTDLLILPPLKGVSKEYIDRIRALHEAGVNLLAFENVPGLEDVFGVKDSGNAANVCHLRGMNGFMEGQEEWCDNERCLGSHAVTDAQVLIQAEIPVLTLKKNANAMAAFFNVPPHLVVPSQLRESICYGRDSVSRFMSDAVAEIISRLSQPMVTADAGRLIAYKSTNGRVVVIVCNPDKAHGITVNITVCNSLSTGVEWSDKPLRVENHDTDCTIFVCALPAYESLVMVLK
ncbi:MAG: hypothetical protein IJS08_15345 [Victivallales bacterium]|nr:hypothetical protein [Victivallales bacterium]